MFPFRDRSDQIHAISCKSNCEEALKRIDFGVPPYLGAEAPTKDVIGVVVNRATFKLLSATPPPVEVLDSSRSSFKEEYQVVSKVYPVSTHFNNRKSFYNDRVSESMMSGKARRSDNYITDFYLI